MIDENLNVEKDDTLDILSLVQNKTKKEENTNTEERETVIGKTPLQEALERRTSGIVVENSELQSGKMKDAIMTEERERDFQKSLDEMDDLIEKSKYVHMNKENIKTDVDKAMAIQALADTDIEDIKALASGRVTKESKNIDVLGSDDVDGDTAKDINASDRIGNVDSKGFFDIRTKDTSVNLNDEPEIDENGNDIVPEEKEDPEKNAMVQIIIDKTGLGIDMNFTEEEKKKIELATTLRVTEVEDETLKTIDIERSDISFLDMINDENYQEELILTPMTFPCSRFKAQMAGLTFGELGDIALSNDSDEYESVRKRYHIVYNKMKNASIGDFESFDDFLKNFAFIDMELAIFGMYISTNPEEDTIILKCNHTGCNKSFEQKFRPRSLIDFKSASKVFLEKTKETADANGEAAKKLHKDSPIVKSKLIKLPDSNYIIELGMLSCYDNLEKIVNTSVIEKFEENHPDDVNNVKEFGTILINIVRSIAIPVKSHPGSYKKFDKTEDILEICYRLSPREFKFLFNLIAKYANDYTVQFGIRDVECPYCHTKTPFVSIDISEQVFRQYQAQLNTNLDLSDMPAM